MNTETTLAWALADAASACFTDDEHVVIFTALGAGESPLAIVRILRAAARARHPLPRSLITQLAQWLDGYAGHNFERRIRALLDDYISSGFVVTNPSAAH